MVDATFAVERLPDVREEVWPLLLHNAAESGMGVSPGAAPVFAWDRYVQLEELGFFQAVVARRGGRIAGYAAWMLTQALHDQATRLAVCDTIYVAPEHRVGRTGLRLIRWCEAHFAAAGFDRLVIGVKIGRVGTLLARMGFKEVERSFAKTLGGEHG